MIFECKDVTLGYENKVVAKNLNFKIDQGDYLCVVGEKRECCEKILIRK